MPDLTIVRWNVDENYKLFDLDGDYYCTEDTINNTFKSMLPGRAKLFNNRSISDFKAKYFDSSFQTIYRGMIGML
jgi:hypothetical protein